MLRQRTSDQGAENIDLAALPHWPDPCVIVAERDALRRLANLLRLTAAESRPVPALSTTRDVRFAADQCGITWHTARTQIESIMANAGVSKQAKLLRLMDLCLDMP